ncbi:hypothetical protein CCMSSC00406_0010398 [Pleurotus cornucopiae]|uniref:Uncharacterized protein n=1 Tax=Pleurotus cornucopiae TaxID=5321 RepID=A0ACB7J3M7_PLECO|nr:hypothetical protein CCMSSC00406_0010398 [Pleurotus cornucopiae]
MQTPAVDLTVLSELIQQLALAQAANQAAGANGGASAAPTVSAVLAPSTAPAPVAANPAPAQAAADVDAAPVASAPAGYFRCPNCDVLHPLAVVGPATSAIGVPTVPATPIAGPSTPATPVAGASNANDGGAWDTIVASLVEGVPRWRCKRFATEQQAQAHFNRALMMNDVHIHADE